MSKSVSISVCTDNLPQAAGLSSTELRRFVRAGLETAVRNRLAPDLAGTPECQRKIVMTHLNDGEVSYLKSLMQVQGTQASVSAATARLAEAGMRFAALVSQPSPAARVDDTLTKSVAAIAGGATPRPEQRALFDLVTAVLDTASRPIVTAQASTGIGKTAVEQALAWRWSDKTEKTDEKTVVAFPTLNGVKSFAAQWVKGAATNQVLPQLCWVFGRSEFVSADALDWMLAHAQEEAPHLDQDALDTIKAWKTAQSAPMPAGQRAWLMDSLIQAEERIDREALEVNGSSQESDAGVRSYMAQFTEAQSAGVVACTHAMLALDVLVRARGIGKTDAFKQERELARLKYFSDEGLKERSALRDAGVSPKVFNEMVAEIQLALEQEVARETGTELRRLPQFATLIVDEAHQLEQAFSNIFSNTVSMRETMRALRSLCEAPWSRARAPLERAVRALSDALKAIEALGSDGNELDLRSNEKQATDIRDALAMALDGLDGVKGPKQQDGVDRAAWARVKRDRETLRMALNAGAGQKRMHFTPVRRYPHITVGSGDVSQPLNVLWAGVQAAVALSATLYMRRGETWSSKYQAALLGIPAHRLKEVPVVEAPWMYRPVKAVYMPEQVSRDEGTGLWLRPATRADELKEADKERAMATWYDELADVIAWIYSTAPGGVMCPSTSHEMVRELAQRLIAMKGLAEAVCESGRYKTLGALRKAAIERAQSGVRPLMLGTGGLWTGFDVSGAELGLSPEQDMLITDLVIGRIPFGMNRSLTHRRRVEDPRETVPHEMLSATLLLQQGIGRLVRGPGLVEDSRRIFVLDGRMVDPKMESYLSTCKKVLSAYRQAVLRRVETRENG